MHVVILAYGPNRLTRSAVRRARALSGATDQLLVVPASELGAGDVGNSRAAITEVVGTPGIAEALQSLGDEPVLLVHDDALVTPRNARRLSESWERTGVVSVPYTNDTGCDPFVGTLPRVDQAAERVDSLASQLEERMGYKVCTTAMYGAASQLMEFTRHRMADPRTTIHDPANAFLVAPAVVAHDGGCRDRLLPANGDTAVIVATMIVKNEEDTLAACLASLEGVVDRVEICDTGSTDGTVAIAESFGANVRHIEWTNHFGDARTAVLESARDALFALQIDADERLRCEDPVMLRRVLATYHREYQGLKVKLRNLDSGGSVSSTFRAIRLFRAEDTVFSGAIHEYATHADGAMLDTSNIDLLEIDHLGYSQAFIVDRNKGQRNLEIAKTQYDTHQDFRTLFDYARSIRLADASDPLSAELFEQTLEVIHGGNPQAQAYVYGTVAIDRAAQGDVDGAIELARLGLDLVPADPMCATGFARAAGQIGEHQSIVDLARWRAATQSSDPLYVIDENEFAFLNELVRAFLELGHVDEAFGVAAEIIEDAPHGFAAWPQLMAALAGLDIDHAEVVVPLALVDSSGTWTGAVAGAFPPAVTAKACHNYLERGGKHPSAVSTGILAAMIAGDEQLAGAFDPYTPMLDSETAAKLAERATARGASNVAEMVAR